MTKAWISSVFKGGSQLRRLSHSSLFLYQCMYLQWPPVVLSARHRYWGLGIGHNSGNSGHPQPRSYDCCFMPCSALLGPFTHLRAYRQYRYCSYDWIDGKYVGIDFYSDAGNLSGWWQGAAPRSNDWSDASTVTNHTPRSHDCTMGYTIHVRSALRDVRGLRWPCEQWWMSWRVQ